MSLLAAVCASVHAWRPRLRRGVCVVSSIAGIAGCARVHSDSCSVDADCGPAMVCREAVCRQPCMASHWVGESVQVTGARSTRTAEIASCEQRRFWVRYESGVEEQVDQTRLGKREQR